MVIHSYTFCIRSVHVPHTKRTIVIESYTFLYVPCKPLAILANLYKMLYVPIRSVHPPRNSCKSLYDVIRSYTFRANPPVLLANRYTFLYVPCTFHIRFAHEADFCSAALPPNLHDGIRLPICLNPPTHVPKWPSLLRSYTFRYTFLYVPGGLFTFPPLELILYIPYTFQYVPCTLAILSGYVPTACIPSHTLGNKKNRERSAWASGPARCVGWEVPSCTNNQLCPSAGTLVCPASSDLPPNSRAAGQSQAPKLVLERTYPGVIRSYTFRATLSRFLWIVLQSYTFLYVPCNPLAILVNCVAKLYVPIRSGATVSRFLRISLQSYTFLYVPRHPSRNSH